MEEPKVIDCFCAWCDLLGYGKIFKDAKWDLHDKSCYANFERIKNVKDLLQNPFTLSLIHICFRSIWIIRHI